MSIPKEPRQLMINIMYLVLTAMLALNVSAEILNAFLSMDRSISDSSNIIGTSNDRLMASIEEQAEAYSQYEPFREKGNAVREISKDFYAYVGELKEEIIQASGGLDELDNPVGMKDKDITTRLLVMEGRGAALEKEIYEVRSKLLALIDDDAKRKELEESIPLKINPIPENTDKENWAQFTFQQMPVAAVMPLLAKMQNDVKVSETSFLNYFFNKTNAESYKTNAFEAVVSANKGYLTVGEKFNAELFLSAYSSTADNVTIQVDGRSIPVRNGKAIFSDVANTIGEKNHEMIVSFRDPVTNLIKTFKKKFSYEVGERSVTTSADKMNVFYVGVDNPLSISAAGIPSSRVRVRAENATINKSSNGKFIVKPTSIGTAKIIVSGGDMDPVAVEYRVKKIPDPWILLGTKKGGPMKAAEFRVRKGIRPHLENFDFKAKCSIDGYEITRQPKGADIISAINRGGAYSGQVKRIVEQAKPGDTYYFDKIKVRCPGDKVGREMGGMIFKIR